MGKSIDMMKKYKFSIVLSVFACGFLWSQTCVGGSDTWRKTVAKVRGAVVHVRLTTKINADDMEDMLPQGHSLEEFFKHFQGLQKPNKKFRTRNAQGSAFIVKIEGRKAYAVTNNHILGEVEEMVVSLDDEGSAIPAKVRGRDPRTDLAVIEFMLPESVKIEPIRWANSDDLRIGDSVMAAGYPFGFKSFSAGIISNIFSGLPMVELVGSVLQIDAMANPGSSGGPALTPNGDVAGVVFSIATTTQANVGITFVIPANAAKRVVEQLIYLGKTKRGWLGVQVQPITDDLSKSLSLPKTMGAMVVDVTPSGPAAKSGLQHGDVIIKFNGIPVASSSALPMIVGRTTVGEKVPIVVWRDRIEKTLSITLGEYEKAEEEGLLDAKKKSEFSKRKTAIHSANRELLGMSLSPISEDVRLKYGIPSDVKGVLISDVEEGSVAAENGLRPGFVILEADSKPVAVPVDLENAFIRLRRENKEQVMLYVWHPHPQRAFLVLPLYEKNREAEKKEHDQKEDFDDKKQDLPVLKDKSDSVGKNKIMKKNPDSGKKVLLKKQESDKNVGNGVNSNADNTSEPGR